MARTVVPLTNTQIDKAKSPNILNDDSGLSLTVEKTGRKVWRFRYAKPFTKKITNISIGFYPETSLSEARQIRETYGALLAQGIDPQNHRQTEKQAKETELATTFETVAWQCSSIEKAVLISLRVIKKTLKI